MAEEVHAGISTLGQCVINFNNAIDVQPTVSNPAFTYEIKYALSYDDQWATVKPPVGPNNDGGVLMPNHVALASPSYDSSPNGFSVYYNTNWIYDVFGTPLIAVDAIGDQTVGRKRFHYYNNPSWSFPQFTKAQGSSDYVHIAVVRDGAGRETVFFNGLRASRSMSTTADAFDRTWGGNGVETDVVVYHDLATFGHSYFGDQNAKSYVSNIKLTTGANLYSVDSATITIPGQNTLRAVSPVGQTPILMNSTSGSTIVVNSGNVGYSNARFQDDSGRGTGCPTSNADLYVGGEGVYNIYYDVTAANASPSSGITVTGSPSKTIDYYDSSIDTPTPISVQGSGTMSVTNYKFKGWTTTKNGVGTVYTAGTNYVPTGNMTFYPVWVPTYTVTYAVGSGGGVNATGTLPTSPRLAQGDTFTVSDNTGPLTRSGYVFTGWKDGANNIYQPGSTYTMGSSAVTLTAQWSLGYNATYNANSATSGSVPAYQPYVVGGSALTLRGNSGNLARTGYTFGGWNSSSAGTGTAYTESQTGVTLSADTIFYAKWNPNTYSITYQPNNATSGNAPPVQSYTSSVSGATLRNNVGALTRTGYTFGGWNTNESGTGTTYTESQTAVSITAETTLYAKWNLGTYSLTYNGNSSTGGTVPASQSYTTNGATLTTRANTGSLVRTGYLFSGWNTNESGTGTSYSETQTAVTITANTILYAKWTPGTYTLSYDSNSATTGTAPTSQSYTTGGSAFALQAGSSVLSRTGYTFSGWNTLANGTGTTYAETATISSIGVNTTLYAKWTGITYAISYSGNSNTSGTAPAQQSYTTGGSTLTLQGRSGLSRTGYTYSGWNTAADGTGTSYNETQTGTTWGANTTLYAKWTPSTYTISYDSNSATSGTAPSSQSYTTGGTAVTANSNTGSLARTGYSFVGWNTASNGSGTTYTEGQTGLTFTSNTTLYAKWSANTYTLSYNANSATSGTAPASQSYTTAGSTLTLRGNSGTLARTGYSFVGWNTAADGSGTSYTDTQSAVTITADTTLYAKWSAGTYTLTYNGNSSTSGTVPSSQNYTSGGSALTIRYNSGSLARTGYTFNGWNTAADGLGTAYSESQTAVTISANATLYAQWSANTYTATYNANSATSGTAPASQNYTTGGTSLTLRTNSGSLVRTGYTFLGWNTSETGTGTNYTAGQTLVTLTSNVTLYAKWSANTYTLSYSTNFATSGSAPASQSYLTDSTTITTRANSGSLARTGYTFSGWNTAADGSGTSYIETQTLVTISADTTLYAKWAANTYSVTYDPNSATSGTAPSSQSYTTAGTALTLRSNTGSLVRAGYTFAGWNTNDSGTGTTYTEGQTSFTTSSNVTLYAKWSVGTYTLSYNSNGATSGSVPASQSYTTGGSSLTLRSNSGLLAKTGYNFSGWNTNANPSLGSSYGETESAVTITSNTVLYPIWAPATFTITYDTNSATSGSIPASQSYTTDGTALTLRTNSGTLTRTGYGFDGWNTAPDGSGVGFTAGQTNTTFTSNTILYAHWSLGTYIATYDGNGSTSGSVPASQSYTTGATALTVRTNTGTLAKTGYTFAGWNTAADGSGTTYGAGATNFTFTSSFTLYAKWTPGTYTISYSDNAASSGLAPSSQSYTTNGSDLTLQSNSGSLVKSGYNFRGWNTAANGSGTSYTEGQTPVVFTADTTLYAKWVAKSSRTLSFSPTSVTKAYLDTFTVTAVPSSETGTITYSAGSSSACSVNTSTGLVTITASSGTCSITASITEGATTLSASTTTPVTVTINKATQAPVTIISASTKGYVDSYNVIATGGSGSGALSYVVSNPGTANCSIPAGETNSVRSTGDAGTTCDLVATRAGDTNYNSRSSNAFTLTISRSSQAALTVSTDSNTTSKLFSADLPIRVSGGSGTGLVSWLISTPGPALCSIIGTAPNYYLHSEGPIGSTCGVTARKLDDINYTLVSSSETTFTVVPSVPSPPRIASVSPGNTEVTVQWTPPADFGGASVITSYEVTSSPGGFTCTTSTLGCSVTGLTNGTPYTFRVTATTTLTSDPSDVSNSATPVTKADAVRRLKAVTGDRTLDVTWTSPLSLGGGTFTRYEISIKRHSDASYGAAINIDTQTVEAYQFTGLTNGVAYDVKVVTITSANTTEIDGNVAEVSQTPIAPPSAVRNLQLSSSDGESIVVTWLIPLSNGGDAIDSYVVTAVSGSQSAVCTLLTDTSTTCTVSGLTQGSTWRVTVKAHTGLGGNGPATAASIVLPSVPGAPTITQAKTNASGALKVSWTAPSSNGGRTIISYTAKIFLRGDPAPLDVATVYTTKANFTITDIRANYDYVVFATNEIGDGPNSDTYTVTQSVPDAPVITGVTSENGNALVTLESTDTTTANIIDYKYSLDGGPFISLRTTNQPFSIPGLTPGRTYSLRILATNDIGDGDPSAAVLVIVLASPTIVINNGGGGGGGGGGGFAPVVSIPISALSQPICSFAGNQVTCSAPTFSVAVTSISYTLYVSGKVISTRITDRTLDSKLITWTTGNIEYTRASLISATWDFDPTWYDKPITCLALGVKDGVGASVTSPALLVKKETPAPTPTPTPTPTPKPVETPTPAPVTNSSCTFSQTAVLVPTKTSKTKVYSQICFQPGEIKPAAEGYAETKKLIDILKKAKVKSISLASFADEKSGVDFKTVAKARALIVSGLIQKAMPKIKLTFRYYGSSLKTNLSSSGRVLVTA